MVRLFKRSRDLPCRDTLDNRGLKQLQVVGREPQADVDLSPCLADLALPIERIGKRGVSVR